MEYRKENRTAGKEKCAGYTNGTSPNGQNKKSKAQKNKKSVKSGPVLVMHLPKNFLTQRNSFSLDYLRHKRLNLYMKTVKGLRLHQKHPFGILRQNPPHKFAFRIRVDERGRPVEEDLVILDPVSYSLVEHHPVPLPRPKPSWLCGVWGRNWQYMVATASTSVILFGGSLFLLKKITRALSRPC